jgi:hypothetical protein
MTDKTEMTKTATKKMTDKTEMTKKRQKMTKYFFLFFQPLPA